MAETEFPVGVVPGIVRRYCRARIGRSPAGYVTADDVAERVTEAILRHRAIDPAGTRPLEAVVYAEMATAVQRVVEDPFGPHAGSRLDRLPARTREVVVLRALVGLTSEQVGRALGLAPDAVTAEQRRALTLLRGA
jgi:RNA polymerase sigma-70 factor, ECF subfamily